MLIADTERTLQDFLDNVIEESEKKGLMMIRKKRGVNSMCMIHVGPAV